MGAGQIGGIATLLDIDFHNAAGFLGEPPDVSQAQHVVMYMSHAMMFCLGALIEAHVVLTPASCVYGERYKFDVIGGTHRFLENTGIARRVHHFCIHKGFNSSAKWCDCSPDNLGLLVLSKQFSFSVREYGTDFVINRVRYGVTAANGIYEDSSCRYFGWGSRRNGYLIPLLINIKGVKAVILPPEKCLKMFNWNDRFLCIQQHQCRSEKHGALCPDDMGSVVVCSGFARGIMTSRLVDRPCGVGFLDLSKYQKFIMCGVDDARDVVDHETPLAYDFTTRKPPNTPSLITIAENDTGEII
ncbi:uncharacterized protein LOC142979510 [Anticarsia gemmatalis]|uniref:uncharacterized protein LOC142979510 n=1 Tax=Anticarsia gemmatalis TaxID=129554 RepID=UPI003F766985